MFQTVELITYILSPSLIKGVQFRHGYYEGHLKKIDKLSEFSLLKGGPLQIYTSNTVIAQNNFYKF